MSIKIRKYIPLLLCGLLLACLAIFMPRPKFLELNYVIGTVVYNEGKKSSGTFLKVQLKDDSELVFNIPNSSKQTNDIVRRIVTGNSIEVWYSDSYTLRRDSYDVWQLSKDGKIIISYNEVNATSIIYSKLFISLSVILWTILLFNIIRSIHKQYYRSPKT